MHDNLVSKTDQSVENSAIAVDELNHKDRFQESPQASESCEPTAVEYIRRLPGGSQSHLIGCSDGHRYVVKFQNNPQGIRTLANELIGTLLAKALGLPIQPPSVVYVSGRFTDKNKELKIELEAGNVACFPGKCFGSRCPTRDEKGRLPMTAVSFDLSKEKDKVANANDALGVFVFDQWTCNTDRRQFLCAKAFTDRYWRLSMIDQGWCFNGRHWNFPESPLWGMHHGLRPYLTLENLRAFQAWILRLHSKLGVYTLLKAADAVPPEWYQRDRGSLHALLEVLDKRRQRMEQVILRAIEEAPRMFGTAARNTKLKAMSA